jgi:endonuclease/exonuclease/phosphatase family metal-dependent hydrolase
MHANETVSQTQEFAMKIGNWNLERVLPSQRRCSAIQAQLLKIDADIWILTETHELVGPGAGYSSVMSGEPDRESEPGEHWAGIWSRHPISHLPSSVSDTARCTAAHIEHPDIGPIVVYAMVLPWGGSQWGGFKSAGGEAFAEALNTYVGDWRNLRAAFPDALHVVAGDFNQDLAPYHYYGSKRQRELLEAALAAPDISMTALTAEANDPVEWDREKRYACIDHICVSEARGLRVGETIKWPESGKADPRLSDHVGVAVELSL